MLREIQQVLRLLMLLGKQNRQRTVKSSGGLMVLLWNETRASAPTLNCTVAAAGPWCVGIQMKALHPVLTDLKESMFPCVRQCPEPDHEELCALTDLYGSIRVLLSFQTKGERLLTPEVQGHIEAFLRTFSLANAGIKIHLKFKFNQQTIQPQFSGKIKRKFVYAGETSLILDVTNSTEPPRCVKKGCWCQGGHPVLGSRVPLSIPPQAMDEGLFVELSIQPVTLLSPCVLQYPNLATRLSHVQVLVYSPSNVPVTGPSTFFQNLPAHLGRRELSLYSLHCSSCKDLVLSGGTVYKVKQEHGEEESSLPTMEQSLLLSLFLQLSDPFTSQLSDFMDTEVLIERHLEDILSNNSQAVGRALQTELSGTLKAQNRRIRDQEKLCSAFKVILSSSICIVSSSSNMDFRNACLNSMKVRDTYELSASLSDSLRKVTSWKFTPRSRCYSAQMEQHLEREDESRAEI